MRRQVAPVRSDSGRTIGQQHGAAVAPGIGPATSGAAQGVGVQRQGLAADRTGEPAKVFGSERHKDRVLGSRFEVRGSRFEVRGSRSEEHTSELQSLRHLVCRLLLEKKLMTNERINSS